MATLYRSFLQNSEKTETPHCFKACSVLSKCKNKVLKLGKKNFQLNFFAEAETIITDREKRSRIQDVNNDLLVDSQLIRGRQPVFIYAFMVQRKLSQLSPRINYNVFR